MKGSIKATCNVIILLMVGILCTGCGTAKEMSDANGQQVERAGEVAETSDNTEHLKDEVIDNSEANQSSDKTENAEDTEEASDNKGEMTEADGTSETLDVDYPALRDCVPVAIEGSRIGCAATQKELDDPKVWEIVTTHFNAITFGNELKPDALFNYSTEKCPGTTTTELHGQEMEVPVLDYSRAEHMLDKIYTWNEEHPDRKIMVRGHVLVWHSQTPEWFFHENYDKKEDYVTPEVMNLRLEWYIREVLTHFTGQDSKYKDMFYGWDVVNEAVSDADGKLRTDAENPQESLSQDRHGSNSSWYHIYGNEDYIINAFTYANQYAPESLALYYNDYNESTPPKREGIANLLQTIKDHEGKPGEGTRITGMGMQGHYSMSQPNMTDVEYAAKLFGRIVGNVEITEFDISASDTYDGTEATKEEENKKLKSRYGTLYFILKSVHKTDDCNITGITFWGTADHYSWLQSRSNVGGGNTTGLPQCPLLFDEHYQPKPCFDIFAVKE